MIDFEFKADEQTLTFFLKGKFSADVNDSFAKLLEDKYEECKRMIPAEDGLKVRFDLTNTVYISSSFIRICMIMVHKLQPGNFSIVNAVPVIKKTFKIAGLDELLNVS